MPEFFRDDKGCIVGAIVALPFGKYGVSVQGKIYRYREELGIVQKSFDHLDEARKWLSEVSTRAVQ